MSVRKPQRFKGKHRQVAQSDTTPEFRARVKKNRRRTKLAKRAQQATRRK